MGTRSGDEAAAAAGLPTLKGGWERQTLALPPRAAADPVQLWVPAQPDQLFDHDAVHGAGDYHESMPYWAWLWDTVPATVEALERRALEGRMLEIGAGLGAVGIALAARSSGRIRATLSDYDPTSISAMEANAALNGLADADVWQLDWRSLDGAEPTRFDFIVGCEVIYDPKSHGALLDVFERFLEPQAGQAFIADPGRDRAPQFVKRARARGMEVQIQDAEAVGAELTQGKFRMLILSLPSTGRR